MAIIYPEKCKGVTGGALRQVARDGYTSASKGLWAAKKVRHMIQSEVGSYFWKSEPPGKFMENLENTQKRIDENTAAIQSAALKLVDAARDANKQMSDVTGKFRDGTEKLSNAIDKLAKVAARGDYAETVRLTSQLVESLERLAALEERGVLDKVMRAMSST